MKALKVMTLNIGNPSLKRVQRQIEWLENRSEDIFVLTETKLSDGCLFLEEHFGEDGTTLFDLNRKAEFNVYFPKSSTGDLGVMVLSRFPIIRTNTCFGSNDPFYSRMIDVVIDFHGQEVGIMGLYVPSRDASQEKIVRKKNFVIQYLLHLKSISGSRSIPYIICGDLNVLERTHMPHYKNFLKWEYDFYDRFDHFGYIDAFRLIHPTTNEYSWVGRTNDGYRYDHIFISRDLEPYLVDCSYVHETRKIPITDHSAMTMTVHI